MHVMCPATSPQSKEHGPAFNTCYAIIYKSILDAHCDELGYISYISL